jgi:phage tail-like protein
MLAAGVGFMAVTIVLWVPVSPAHAQIAQNVVHLQGDSHVSAYVTGVVGVGSETEVIESKVIGPGGQEIIRKIPGRLKYLDITLEREITDNLDLARWRELVETGRVAEARVDIVVTVFDPRLDPIARWSGTECWPSSIENLLPDPNSASEADEFVEKLVIVCEGLVRTQ